MRLHRFYIQTPISKETFDITDKNLVHQWRNVFRYNVGSQVIIFDGSGIDYLCIITSLRSLGATVSITGTKENKASFRRNVWLCLSVIKKSNFELVVEKATELGVNHVLPILTERSEKKNLDIPRLKKIAVEAGEQSGRGDTVEIHEITELGKLFKSGILPQDKIVLDPSGTAFHQYVVGTSFPSIVVFVGPEGGWSDKEIEFFKSYNVPILSLGSQILRAETAAIAVASLLLLEKID